MKQLIQEKLKLAEERDKINADLQLLEQNRKFMAESEQTRKYLAENQDLVEAIELVKKTKDQEGVLNPQSLARIIAEEERAKGKAVDKGKKKLTTADSLKAAARRERDMRLGRPPATERLLAGASTDFYAEEARKLTDEPFLVLDKEDGSTEDIYKSDPRYENLLQQSLDLLKSYEMNEESLKKATEDFEAEAGEADNAPADNPPPADNSAMSPYTNLSSLLTYPQRRKFLLYSNRGKRMTVNRSQRTAGGRVLRDPVGMFIAMKDGRTGFLYFNLLPRVEYHILIRLSSQIRSDDQAEREVGRRLEGEIRSREASLGPNVAGQSSNPVEDKDLPK